MADGKQDNAERQPANISGPSTPSVGNNISMVKDENTKPTDTPENNNTKCNNPQPFIIKMEKGKGLSKSEIISLIGILISGSLFFMTIKAFKKTAKAVEISEASLNHAIYKDSIAVINDKKRNIVDSIKREQDAIRDAITIKQTQQSLDAQLNSIKQTQKDFELESRAFLQVRNIKVDTVAMDKGFTINFKIADIGKFPAKVVFYKIGITYGGEPTPEEVRQVLDKANGWQIRNANEVVSSTTEIGIIQPASSFNAIQLDAFKRGKFSIYFAAEFRYISLGIERKYAMKFVIKITRNPDLNNLDFQTIEYSDTEIK